MDQFLFAVLLLISGPLAKPAELPTVVFAPDAWNDPPRNQDFQSCKVAHPDAVSAGSPDTKPPTILPVKSSSVKEPGRIIAELYVEETGKLREIRVLRAQGERFVEQSLKELKGATIKPGTARGQPVAMCFAINRWTEAR